VSDAMRLLESAFDIITYIEAVIAQSI